MATASNTASVTGPKAAGLPPLPPLSRTPNIFANLEPGSAPRRAERNDSTSTAVAGRQHLMVSLSAVVAAGPLQTRAPFATSDGEDQALLESLELVGQQVPVILERLGGRQPAEYRILDGHRRIAALRLLGRAQVEAVVVQPGTQDADWLSLSANVRKNLAPLELAEAIGRLEARGLSHAEIGRRIGLTRQHVDNLGCLLRLGDPLKEQVRAGRLGMAAAVLWESVPGEHHAALAHLCAEADVTVAQARAVADALKGGRSVTEAAEMAGARPTAVAGNSGTPAGGQVQKSVQKPKANRIPGAEAASDLLRGYFPELELRTVRSLSETAVRRRTTEQDLKVAGCFAAAGLPPVEALDRARSVSGRLWARKVVAMLDRMAELEALCLGDRCPPEAAQVFSVLARRVGVIKSLGRGADGAAKGARPSGASKP